MQLLSGVERVSILNCVSIEYVEEKSSKVSISTDDAIFQINHKNNPQLRYLECSVKNWRTEIGIFIDSFPYLTHLTLSNYILSVEAETLNSRHSNLRVLKIFDSIIEIKFILPLFGAIFPCLNELVLVSNSYEYDILLNKWYLQNVETLEIDNLDIDWSFTKPKKDKLHSLFTIFPNVKNLKVHLTDKCKRYFARNDNQKIGVGWLSFVGKL